MGEIFGVILGLAGVPVLGMLLSALGAREIRDAVRGRGEQPDRLLRLLAAIDLSPRRGPRLPAALLRRRGRPSPPGGRS